MRHKYTFFSIRPVCVGLLLGLAAPWCWADGKLKPYEEYVARYANEAMQQQRTWGVPASITLAQGLLESGAGNSALAQNSHNHFGIKCGSRWEGATYSHWDDGELSCFRQYDNVLDSYSDHSRFLRENVRYASLFELDVKDYKGWAYGLKAAGYATDKQYADKLISVIETYQLYQYDRQAARHKGSLEEVKSETTPVEAGSADKPQTEAKTKKAKKSERQIDDRDVLLRREKVASNAKDYSLLAIQDRESRERHQPLPEWTRHPIEYRGTTPYIVARYGDTYARLADEFDLPPAYIRSVNDFPKKYLLEEGDIVYLSRKASSWQGEEEACVVRAQDSWHSLSQQYAVQLKALYQLNGLKPGDPLYTGQTVQLR